ncbi:22824_t:CDS:1, partial [Cetraspora pellucida]
MSKNQLLINQLLTKIDQLTVSLEEQKQENKFIKETHINEI